jgi:molecular chaperone DnaK
MTVARGAGGRPEALHVLGIDLGTTNSTVAEATLDGGTAGVRCVEVEQPTEAGAYTHVLLPSVVALHDGRVWVGEGAKRLRARAPELGLEQNRNLFFDCKNEIGIAKTYHRAPEGFRSAAEIGGRVLGALLAAARDGGAAPERVVVTVPASFQAAQRRDTLAAARLAGLELAGGDLLDEPVAALLDLLATPQAAAAIALAGTLVVLDFGGGTCDVAVMALAPAADGSVEVAPRAVSRYHRLGGGDIDAAIVHEVLIPRLEQENGLGPFELEFEERKRVLEPALLGVAEALKVSLCSEVARLVQFGKYDGADRDAIAAQQPVTLALRAGGRTLTLARPRLSAAEFEAVLAPFLDRDMLYARETEYRLTCSVFAPLQDALDRAEVEATDVSYVLTVGGSSLIPQVAAAVRDFFPDAQVLTFSDRDAVQTAVARGAARHALALATTGRGLVRPVANDTISLRTESRLVELIRKGSELPVPPEGWARRDGLTVPVTSPKRPVDVRVELVAGEDGGERPLFRGRWSVPAPVSKGDGLVLEYRYDANQVLELRLRLATAAGTDAFACAVENPCTNVVNPQAARVKLETLEEALRTGQVPRAEMPGRLVEAAELMAELGQRERAFAQLRKVLQSRNAPDGAILNRMGTLAAEIGDAARAEKLYREAAAVEPAGGGPLFNLALLLERRGDAPGALAAVEAAVEREPAPPYLALRSRLRRALGDAGAAERDLAAALAAFAPPPVLSEWALGWLATAAAMRGDAELQEKARAELKLRRRGGDEEVGGVLPGLRHLEIVRE